MAILGPTAPSPSTAADLPHVHFMATKFLPGAKGMADSVPVMHRDTMKSLFTRTQDTDAHFVCYHIPGESDIPRLTLPILSKIQAAGGNVLSSIMAFDWDTPDHVPLTKELFDGFFNTLLQVGASWPVAVNWSLLYTTRAGCRLVYILETPTTVDRAESYHRGIVQSFKDRGITLDPACSDWTRVFRLPYVIRDGSPTWPLHLIVDQWPNRLSLAGLPEIAKARGTYGEVKQFNRTRPDADACRKLLHITNDKGHAVQTDFHTHARRRLRGRECYPILFENHRLAEPGNRNTRIHELVGQVVSLMFHVEGTTPEMIHALFLPAVEQLDIDPTGPAWSDVLWSSIGRLWSMEEAKIEEVRVKVETEQARQKDLASSVIEGMRTWCFHPNLTNPATMTDFMSRHLICSVQNNYFLMRSDGTYDMTPLLSHQLIATIRGRGMDTIIETKFINERGASADVPVAALIGRYATIVSHIVASPKPGGADIQNIDTPEATLYLPNYWRNEDLKPTYDADVDEWLKVLSASDYKLLCKWIGEALAFDEGSICALSITGHAGAGKKMLTEALGECLRLPRTAGSEDMIGEHNYGLARSPFLVVDEGWTRSKGGRHPADEFRHLVSGDRQTIKQKYLAPIDVINPCRIVFTANNLEAVRVLSHKRDLSPEDQEALSIRLMHLDVGGAASTWLKEKGGLKFTAAPGRRWIRGDGGEKSDYIVAKHFLWLHEHRHELGIARGGRFLVEGNASERVLFDLRTQAGVSPLVIEALIKMLEKPMKTWEGMAIIEDRLYVAAAEVLDFYRNNLQDRAREPITADQVLNTFKGLAAKGSQAGAYVLKGKESAGPRKWNEIDCRVLLQVAQKDGWPCAALAGIVARQAGVAGVIKPVSAELFNIGIDLGKRLA